MRLYVGAAWCMAAVFGATLHGHGQWEDAGQCWRIGPLFIGIEVFRTDRLWSQWRP